MAERGQTDKRGASGTGENDWHTPDKYLEAARSVLGVFDLDPASSKAAQKRIWLANRLLDSVMWLVPPAERERLRRVR